MRPNAEPGRRRFLVSWRDGQTPSRIHPVGCLVADTSFRYAYLESASSVRSFRPFPSFPDLGRTYVSSSLFPFFAARVMDRRRPDFASYVEALNLASDATDIDLLARHDGLSKGDHIAVTEEPAVEPDGSTQHVMVVKGLRYALPDPPSREKVLADLTPGTVLEVVADRGNQVNSEALFLRSPAGPVVGWIPDALVGYVSEIVLAGGPVVVQRCNGPGQPAHLRLLARVQGRVRSDFAPLPALPRESQDAFLV